MTNYAKGRKNEYKTMRLLESLGYVCSRTAGSHGTFDVIGVSRSDVVFIQCKSNEWPNPAEVEKIERVLVPSCARKLIHRWDDHARMPLEREV